MAWPGDGAKKNLSGDNVSSWFRNRQGTSELETLKFCFAPSCGRSFVVVDHLEYRQIVEVGVIVIVVWTTSLVPSLEGSLAKQILLIGSSESSLPRLLPRLQLASGKDFRIRLRLQMLIFDNTENR